MPSKYIVLPRLEFRGANAQPAWWCSAPPGPMAARGFANALAIAMGGQALMGAVIGASLVYHDVDLRAERIGEPYQKIHAHQLRAASWVSKADYVGSGMALSSQPTIRCDGVVSIILACGVDTPVDHDAIDDFLMRARFAGGSIVSHGFNRQRPLVVEGLQEASSLLRSGFAFHDRTDLLERQEGERDPLDSFLRATRRMPATEKRRQADGDDDGDAKSWLMPYLASFRRISPLNTEGMSRDGHPHAFAEPLVGLGQLVSLRQASAPVWDYRTKGELHMVSPVMA